jgi:hypothetical protein
MTAGGPPAATSPTPTVPPAPPLSTMTVPTYTPTWLPPHLIQRQRYIGVDRSMTQTWQTGSGNQRVSIDIRPAEGANDPQVNDGTPVTINGKQAYYHPPYENDDKSYVEWRLDEHSVIGVTQVGLGLSKANLLHIATSMQPDPTPATVVVDAAGAKALRFLGSGVSIEGTSSQSWTSVTEFQPAGTASAPANKESKNKTGPGQALRIEIGTSCPAGGATGDVNGHPTQAGTITHGPVEAQQQEDCLRIDFAGPGHRYITIITSGVAKEDVTKLAGTLDWVELDVSWIGKGQ